MSFARNKVISILKKLNLYRLLKYYYHSSTGLFFRKILRRLSAPFFSNANEQKKSRLYLGYSLDNPLLESTVLYESFHGTSISCSPYAIYKYIRSKEKYSHLLHVWVIRKGVVIPNTIDRTNVLFVYRGSKEYLRYLATAKFLVNNSTFPTYMTRRDGQIYINTWHGVPLKKMFMHEGAPTVHANSARNFLQSTHLLFPNHYTANTILESAGISGILEAHVTENCSPRTELTRAATPSNVKKSLGLNFDCPIILYAPTWRGTLSQVLDENEIIGKTIALLAECAPDFHILVSIHNFAERLHRNFDRVTVLDGGIDINEVLSCVDILVSDYSSLIFDFIPMRKPIVLYAYDLVEYSSQRGFYFELEMLPAVLTKTSNELKHALSTQAWEQMESHDAYSADTFSPCFLQHDETAHHKLIDDILGGASSVNRAFNNDKKNVVAYLGGLKTNGISTSAINLTANFDFENYNLIVLTPGSEIESDDEKLLTLSRVDKRCNIIHRVGRISITTSEAGVMDAFYSTNTLENGLRGEFTKIFRREKKRILGNINIDVAIDFSGYARYWALLIGFSGAPKRVIYQHNDMLSEAESRFDILFGVFSSYQSFDKIISVSEPTMVLNRSKLSELYPGIYNKFDFVQNYIVPAEIIAASKEFLKLPGGNEQTTNLNQSDCKDISQNRVLLDDGLTTNFVTMGRFSPEKDQQKLIRAFSTLSCTCDNARLFLIGTGPLEGALRSLSDELGLDDKVIFTGQLINPFPLMSACDAFILSSNYEGQPMVLLEALVLNLPIIATDIVGSRSVIGDRYGLLVENSEAGLVRGMMDILNNNYSSESFDPVAYVKDTNTMFVKKVLL